MNNFGFLNINKPSGMTSHDVVSKLRRVSKIKQIGHTGTLDPLADGVLPIAAGKATRLIEYLKEDKAYIATSEFGKISDTYDSEGVIEKFSDLKTDEKQIDEALCLFRGEIEQIPPAHSAVHYKGKRLYELARAGMIPEDIPKRRVNISKIELLNFDEEAQRAQIEIECSKGTYVRSIINDLGMRLETGAIMTALTRTKSGCFNISNAVSLENIQDKEAFERALINPVTILPYKKQEIDANDYEKIKNGRSVKTNSASFSDDETVCLTFQSELCAIAQADIKKGLLVMKKVFV